MERTIAQSVERGIYGQAIQVCLASHASHAFLSGEGPTGLPLRPAPYAVRVPVCLPDEVETEIRCQIAAFYSGLLVLAKLNEYSQGCILPPEARASQK